MYLSACQVLYTCIQESNILRARTMHIDKLIGLYNERAVIANKAAGLANSMQGPPVHGRLMGAPESGVLSVLMRHGYLYCARHVVTMHKIMDALQVSRWQTCHIVTGSVCVSKQRRSRARYLKMCAVTAELTAYRAD